VVESDFVFDTKKCADTYRKFSDAYGSSMPETGLPSKVVDIGFFFVDIVGLSDPRLSVKSQVQKIEVLNRLIAECDAFKKTPAGQKLVLPAGDGMAIGFLLNPELPLELAIQLHRKLGQYNRERKWAGDRVQVRIGLGSGPIFTVSDLTNAQNVWGPGIILARRVMDAGDEGHILLAGNIAEDLIALKDEYRSIIRMVSDSFEIKHGQKIRLYSAYSPADFGNPQPPARAKAS
jgi:class 3 adenylate cyclase